MSEGYDEDLEMYVRKQSLPYRQLDREWLLKPISEVAGDILGPLGTALPATIPEEWDYDVVTGLEYVMKYSSHYNLRVANLSLGTAIEQDLTRAELADGFLIGNAVRGLVKAQLV